MNLEAEKNALLQLHADDRRAHFETNVPLLMSHGADTFISVSNGVISHTTADEVKQTFTRYFQDAIYYEWDDLEPPIVRISNDASMAWMIVRTKVQRTQKNENGDDVERKFVYAGIMTYEKQDGKWVRIANVSTFV